MQLVSLHCMFQAYYTLIGYMTNKWVYKRTLLLKKNQRFMTFLDFYLVSPLYFAFNKQFAKTATIWKLFLITVINSFKIICLWKRAKMQFLFCHAFVKNDFEDRFKWLSLIIYLSFVLVMASFNYAKLHNICVSPELIVFFTQTTFLSICEVIAMCVPYSV